MPKPLNASIGTCPCAMAGCAETAQVKKEKGKRGRLYLVCRAHGVINLAGRPFQEFILERATITGEGGAAPVPARGPEFQNTTGKGTATLERPPANHYQAVNIERGPDPEPYPSGVSLEQPKAKPAPVPAQGPKRASHSPEPKPTEQQPQRGGFRPFGWLTDGLKEL